MKTQDKNTNEEIEVKILEIDPKEVQRRILKLGAKLAFFGRLRTIFLDNEDALESQKALIRIRDFGKRTVITYKRRIEQKNVRKSEEIEVEVSDFSQMLKIFKNLGFQKKAEYFKERKHFTLGKMSFEIDSIPGIPPILEIEGPSEKEVLKYVRKLGFSKKDALNWTGRQLAEHYGKTL